MRIKHEDGIVLDSVNEKLETPFTGHWLQA